MNIEKIKRIVFDYLRYFGFYNHLSDEEYLRMRWKKAFSKELNIKNPQSFNEKMQWLKLNNRKDIYSTMVDKYEAKEYVERVLGEEYITKTLGLYNNYDEIDFDDLPDQFVLKCTHDSGGLVICSNKSNLDIKSAKKKIMHCLKQNYYMFSREWPYKNVKPRIIAEQYLENGTEGLHDYKVWCFNGKVKYIQYITGRVGKTYEAFYDRDWVKQEFSFHNPLYNGEITCPQRLEELIRLSETLAKGIPFVRTDFYILESGDIKFGEITFYPMSGFEHWSPEEIDYKLGEMIDLSYGK